MASEIRNYILENEIRETADAGSAERIAEAHGVASDFASDWTAEPQTIGGVRCVIIDGKVDRAGFLTWLGY